MNINMVFENFIERLNESNSLEEKEYAMIEAYDSLDDSFTPEEKKAIYRQMMQIA
ncbi:MAG: hypothetical protein J6W04_02255 [Bacteroidales bacterium]|nr:hypothetical protein [Bacteroidales bacterium]